MIRLKHDDRFFYVSVAGNVSSSSELFAVNLTKVPQGGLTNEQFIAQTRLNSPEDLYDAFVSGLPGYTFKVELIGNGAVRTTNHIRVYLNTGLGAEDDVDDARPTGTIDPYEDGSSLPSLPNGELQYETVDIYVDLEFHHAEVAQDFFQDLYGHWWYPAPA